MARDLNLFLNMFNEAAVTTSSGSLFHESIIREEVVTDIRTHVALLSSVVLGYVYGLSAIKLLTDLLKICGKSVEVLCI